MSRKANKGNRCKKCRMLDSHCICSYLIGSDNQTPITILMHHRETLTTTNTGRIAHFLLNNSSIHYRGLIESPLKAIDVLQRGYTPLYLYPSEESVVLTQELAQSLGNRVQLIIPDGSWRQAKRVARREPFLKDVKHVRLSDATSGIFFLRRKIKEEGVSTIEAIARALGVIESSELQQNLENVFKIMVEKTLETRGKKLENYKTSSDKSSLKDAK